MATVQEQYSTIKTRLEKLGQEHLLAYFGELSDAEKQSLLTQIACMDLESYIECFKRTVAKADPTAQAEELASKALPEPLGADEIGSTIHAMPSTVEQWHQNGIDLLAQGKVATLVMAGGQGTRLGSSAPKGCYDVGIPSHKSLFQLQAERIKKLGEVVAAKKGLAKPARIPWLVMTSAPTHDATIDYIKSNGYFGLSADDVVFFDQGVLPCFTFEGKIMLETKSKVAVAPDGNGGIYEGLRVSGTLRKLREMGIQYLHAYCVDNILVRPADPTYVGYCAQQGSECGAMAVPKSSWDESVGVVCRRNGRFEVVEYSEISEEIAKMTRPGSDELLYNAGNICNHFYTLDFLERTPEFESKLEHHVANKKIKSIDLATGEQVKPTKPNGIKLERFVFDVFPYCKTLSVLEVDRRDQFSPLKNAPGAGADCPETSRHDLIAQHIRFAEAAGATVQVDGEPAFELAPAVTYEGEGLESLKGRTLSGSQLLSAL
ncbi:UDP-N-acetylglucosamine diphosphorylase [Martensiomyces pterosporus]|nr:UDP-N-acetylglucosamine diphosphorylase [Martensiomyces pterosporus]